jgi:hypothetical protein
VAGLRDLYETDELRAVPSPPTAAHLVALVDRVIAFTHAGICSSPTTPGRPGKTNDQGLE